MPELGEPSLPAPDEGIDVRTEPPIEDEAPPASLIKRWGRRS